MALGSYREGHSLAHGLDPRTKIVFAVLYLVAAFVADGPVDLGLVAVVAVLSLAACGVSPSGALKLVVPFAPLMLFVAIIDLLFTTGTQVWWQAGPLCVSAESTAFAVSSVLRFACVLLATGTLMQVTSSTQLADGALLLMRPLGKWGIPVENAAMAVGLTLRFVPVVADELHRVKSAQAQRLADFDTGGVRDRLHAYGSVVVPLFVGALRRSQTLALALENRRYEGTQQRSCFRSYGLEAADVGVFAIAAGLLAFCLFS